MGSEPLPNLISDLTSSEGDSDRMRTKKRFIERCQVLETKLNFMLQKNADNVSCVVESTSRAINVLADSKARCQDLKDRIVRCKEVLQRKRDDIRKLWLESLEHKAVCRMLEEIKKLSEIPNKIDQYLNDKNYIEATKELASALALLDGNFQTVDSLTELKMELHRLENKLYSIFIEELRQEIYWSTFRRTYGDSFNADKHVTYEKIFHIRISKDEKVVCLNSTYVKVLLECITLLQKWPETLEFLKDECQNDLICIIQKLSKLMLDIVQNSTGERILDLPKSDQHTFLTDILETVFDHFKCLILNFKEFINISEKIVASSTFQNVQIAGIYSDIQVAIEKFISSYLEEQSLENNNSSSKVLLFPAQNLNDVNFYFSPHCDRECPVLFKFSDSSSNPKKNRKSIENQKSNNSKIFVLVCQPSLKNITLIFNPVKRFVNEIKSLAKSDFGEHCPLHTYLYDSALVFLDQVNSEINKILENAAIGLQSWNVSFIPGDEPGAEKEILNSTLILNKNLSELQLLVKSLPDYANHFLHLIYFVVLDYKDMLQKAFKTVFGDEHNILSISWAKDHDIRRLLKSFSNWKHLEESKSVEGVSFPEEVRLRNKEESRLLIRNLHAEEYDSWETIKDFDLLLNLAVLQESSQWFSVQLYSFMDRFYKLCDPLDCNVPIAIAGFKKLIKEYEDFADVCLLTLHLEVRAHCFYHLLPPSDSDDTFFGEGFEISAQNLTAELAKIDETLRPVLTPKELKYIFEGVGELVASILIHNVSSLKSAPESLIKRITRCIFVIQCSLSNITLAREVALERARHYMQLLNLTCDDILNEILEEGPVFNEQEYAAVFRLILGTEDNGALDNYVVKLKYIFRRISANI